MEVVVFGILILDWRIWISLIIEPFISMISQDLNQKVDLSRLNVLQCIPIPPSEHALEVSDTAPVISTAHTP
jgi:hypothetical protein